MEAIIGTYKIVNKLDSKMYYGSSEDVYDRIKRHKKDLRKNIHHNIYLQRAFNKYGETNFDFLLDIVCQTVPEARNEEQNVLDTHPNLYNIGLMASGGDNLSNHPNREEIINRITESVRKRYENMTENEKKEKYGRPGDKNPMYGRTHTEEVRQKLSDFHKGNKHALGIKWTDEQKKKLSQVASLRIGEKNPFYGKAHLEETKKYLSEKNKGKLPPNLRPVIINKKEYISVTEAARQLNVCPATIIYRIKKGQYKYKYQL